MRTLIIYSSIHHDNTQKIAQMMAKTLEAELFQANDLSSICFKQYDLIGFGSGIYNGKHHAKLFQIVENASIKGKDVFVFSTSGTGNPKYNNQLIQQLSNEGANVKNSFSCKGFDTYGILKWIGGIAKGHPNSKDLEDAHNFIKKLIAQTT